MLVCKTDQSFWRILVLDFLCLIADFDLKERLLPALELEFEGELGFVFSPGGIIYRWLLNPIETSLF